MSFNVKHLTEYGSGISYKYGGFPDQIISSTMNSQHEASSQTDGNCSCSDPIVREFSETVLAAEYCYKEMGVKYKTQRFLHIFKISKVFDMCYFDVQEEYVTVKIDE